MNINGHEIAGRMPLFKPENRQAIRDGRKTQTRRVIKPQPILFENNQWFGRDLVENEKGRLCAMDQIHEIACPYRVGDIRVMCEPLARGVAVFGSASTYYQDSSDWVVVDGKDLIWRWKRDYLPQMFMPYEAARSLFEITDIRVARIDEISAEDAIAEGIERYWDDGVWYYGPFDNGHADPIFEMRRLWDSINKSRGGSWESNPWVWVYKFKQVEERS